MILPGWLDPRLSGSNVADQQCSEQMVSRRVAVGKRASCYVTLGKLVL